MMKLNIWSHGFLAGAVGSVVVVPTDLIRVRLQAEGKLETGKQARYRGFWHALTDIFKMEGFRGLYRGTSPTVQRAMVVTATQVRYCMYSNSIAAHVGECI